VRAATKIQAGKVMWFALRLGGGAVLACCIGTAVQAARVSVGLSDHCSLSQANINADTYTYKTLHTVEDYLTHQRKRQEKACAGEIRVNASCHQQFNRTEAGDHELWSVLQRAEAHSQVRSESASWAPSTI
jgi:hypothetical protein